MKHFYSSEYVSLPFTPLLRKSRESPLNYQLFFFPHFSKAFIKKWGGVAEKGIKYTIKGMKKFTT